jgi:two-component system cell cycle sensor histidine kinase/response regulator CckA
MSTSDTTSESTEAGPLGSGVRPGLFTGTATPAPGRPLAAAPEPSPISPGAPSRLEYLGRMTASVAHDFNNLLSVIMVCAGEIADGAGDETLRIRAREIQAAADRGAALSRRLLSAEGAAEPPREPIAVDVAIIDSLGLLKRAVGREIEISVTSEGRLPLVELIPGELERILLNLAKNSRDAMPNGGSLAIRTGLVAIPAGDPTLTAGWFIRMAVTDTGTGMEPETASRAMQPYFSTKLGEEGTGLGLATVHGLAQAAGGDLRINTTPGTGTTVSVYLPAPDAFERTLAAAA